MHVGGDVREHVTIHEHHHRSHQDHRTPTLRYKMPRDVHVTVLFAADVVSITRTDTCIMPGGMNSGDVIANPINLNRTNRDMPAKPRLHHHPHPLIRVDESNCHVFPAENSTYLYNSPARIRGPHEELGREEMGGRRIRDAEAELNLPPGFRFHPTDEELLVHYLCRRASHQLLPVPIIAELDLYKYNPWDLPDKALFGTREWYFFTPRDRKYPNGSRPNRAAGRGYWKATGADKPVTPAGSSRPVGIKKALVFYDGKPPKGAKTDWIMHEYRLVDANRGARRNGSLRLDDWVLCRLYNKKKGWEKMPKEETDLTEESFRTPESDIELPDYDDFGQEVVDMNQSSGATQLPAAAPTIKEEYDWYSDLNLEDLHNSFGPFRSTPAFDVSTQECYVSSLVSPNSTANLASF